MYRRAFLQGLGLLGTLPFSGAAWSATQSPVSVSELPPLEGPLRLYLGRGEGGLYEDVLDAIVKRNPKLDLSIRRGSNAALTNAILAEAKAGVQRADLFWAVDSGAVGQVVSAGLSKSVPAALTEQLRPQFRFNQWVPISGRVRTLAYNSRRVRPEQIPDQIMALPDSDLSIGWAPSYAAFQSFLTAMRLLRGDEATLNWLRRMKPKAKVYAGELGVVMAVERGAVDVGLSNHYYTLRLKAGRPDASVDLSFTDNDAGCLVNASGAVALTASDTAFNFIRYLLTREVQEFLADQAYEIPLVEGVKPPPGVPAFSPPDVDLIQLAQLRPTLDLMRTAGVL